MTADSQNPDVNALAAAWDARLRSHDCSADERDRLSAWLRDDRRHREAFDRLQAAISALRDAGDHPQLRALREGARLVELRAARRRSIGRWAVAASLGVVAVSAALWSLQREPASPGALPAPSPVASLNSPAEGIWATTAREKRTIALPDGSSMTLNASTRVEAQWLPQERRIHLVSGQALFQVAKDKARPFIVTAGDRTVTAVGTAFDVLLSDRWQVTVLEGRVVVKEPRTSSNQWELTPGQQLIAVGGSTPHVRTVNAGAEAAWAQGPVFFADESLPDAIKEMNQYSPQQIIAGPELSGFRVNGMFRAGNQQGFVSALTTYFPIQATQDAQGRILLRLRGRPSAH